tara:strand:- start:4774 stop:6039 length:1266 start_codon:yes stop_codon:yes gene_type:complete
MKIIFTFLFSIFFLSSFAQYKSIGRTEVVKTNNGFQLLRDGMPYYVNGAGGDQHLDILNFIGGNSIRTWGTENAKEILDKSHELGISVCLGLWVGHERHGFNYNDEYAVKAQLESFKKEILKFKDHPALLMWAVGNEVDLFYSNFRVWDAVGEIANMIKELDPNHPVMTVTAGIDPSEIYMIKTHCPDIDILGINTYGGIKDLSSLIKKYGWQKPYMVTEWGPYGHWESPLTSWGVAIEASSKEKAEFRDQAYQAIEQDSTLCLGSYAFLWGYKQEQTPTWYGIFTKNGNATQSVDILNSYWKKNKKNSAPIINYFELNGYKSVASVKIKRKKECHFTFDVIDLDNDSLSYFFELMPESNDKKSGGDFEKTPEPVSFSIINQTNNDITIKAPRKKGAYRFFIYAHDGFNNVATANFPFYVK